MINTDKYEGHTEGKDTWAKYANWATARYNRYADTELIADAPLLLEFIEKVVESWGEPNQCNSSFGKDVRQLMYEYGLITFNEETQRYEVNKND